VVYDITGSGALLGAVLGVRAIPMLLLTPISGVAADRYDRQRLLQISQGLAAAVSFAFGAALALEMVGTWMLFAFTILMGASNVIDRPARMTSGFELVPREIAVNAVALNTMGFSLMRVFGPVFAGYLIAGVGAAGTFFVQGVLYAASGLAVLMVTFPPRRVAAPGRTAASDMAEGLRYAAGDPTTRALLAIGLLPYFLLVPVWGTLFPIYTKDIFAAGPEVLGLLLTSVGVGGTVGGLIANALSRVERQGLLQAGWAFLMALAVAGLAASPTVGTAMLCGFVGGAAEMAHTASNLAMIQVWAPEAMRGRIISLSMLYPAFISLGALLSGPLADLLGVRGASLAVAATAAVAVLAMLIFMPRLRELRHR